ncbi:C-type lectin domain family 10 member A-like [Chelmon rostratus]|uniref:C-type lectin domain family 10 member A-like n=1 Tax=Chelmon rostratus TaxID=109905 RepID=UPI001BEBD88F|nr:C-type lectin domain family 10 member A-like [Chelmon rostratus]
MQQMEVSDYINEQPRFGQKRSEDPIRTERRLCQLLFISFGLLCIIQATLNVSLRLTLHSSKESTRSNCSAAHFNDQNQLTEEVRDCEQRWTNRHNRLLEKFNALTGERNLLQNENNELKNMLRKVEEERDRLKKNLREPSSCVSQPPCPVGWREINFKCYFLSNESKTWEDSRKYCQSKDADLVVIDSQQEQMDLYRLDGDAYLLFWIGLYDTAGNFKWVDGSVLTRSFWQRGQPDHGGPNIREDCVEMYHFNPQLANWNDAPCGSKRRWLCEKSVDQLILITKKKDVV